MDHPLSPFQKSDGGNCIAPIKSRGSAPSKVNDYHVKEDFPCWILTSPKRGTLITLDMVHQYRYLFLLSLYQEVL